MRKRVGAEALDMMADAAQEALRQTGLDEESFRLLLTRKEEFCKMLIDDIRSSIEAVTNERLHDILSRSIELEKRSRKDPEAMVEEVKDLMRDAASAGSSVREREQREKLESLISYWASRLRIQTGELVLSPGLDPFLKVGN
jgi:uncharacterized protein (UPF0335 family)